MAMKMKYSINKCSHVANRVGPGYGELAYISFTEQVCNFNFTDVESDIDSSVQTLYRIIIRV
jgi:hypothetical protein